MLFSLTIPETVTPAMWNDAGRHEVAAMLRQAAAQLEDGHNAGNLTETTYHRQAGAWEFTPEYDGETVEFAGKTYSTSQRPDLPELTPEFIALKATRQARRRGFESTGDNDAATITAPDGSEIVLGFERRTIEDGRQEVDGWTITAYNADGEDTGTDGASVNDMGGAWPHYIVDELKGWIASR